MAIAERKSVARVEDNKQAVVEREDEARVKERKERLSLPLTSH